MEAICPLSHLESSSVRQWPWAGWLQLHPLHHPELGISAWDPFSNLTLVCVIGGDRDVILLVCLCLAALDKAVRLSFNTTLF